MTVSRVLGDENHKVSQETRERVLKAVRELEYVPVAQPVTQSRNFETRVIGLHFVGTQFEGLWGQPTFFGFREAAQRLDYDLLVHTRTRPDWMADQEEMQFLDRRSDGLIFIAPVNQRHVLETLVKRKLPVVACYMGDIPPEVPWIVVDNEDAMKQSVDFLAGKGHERILHLTALPWRSDFQARIAGYEQAMQARKLEPEVLTMEQWPSPEAARYLMQVIKQHRITAIVGHNDASAIFAWDVAQNNGLRVPEDLSIIGMDDLAKPAQRGLTSMHFSCEEVGRRAMEAVVDLIQGKTYEAQKCIVPVEMVERASVTAVR